MSMTCRRGTCTCRYGYQMFGGEEEIVFRTYTYTCVLSCLLYSGFFRFIYSLSLSKPANNLFFCSSFGSRSDDLSPANELNLPSLRAAGRLGFSDEGRIVHQRVLNAGLVGSYPGRTGDAHQGRDSRTTAVFGMGYHQWAGIRERLQEMVRKTY